MTSVKYCTWAVLIAAIATSGALAIGLCETADDKTPPLYATGQQQTARGTVLATPGINVAQWASYAKSGEAIVFDGAKISPAGTDDGHASYWVWERSSGRTRLLHENFAGEMAWGQSLSMYITATPWVDGSTLAVARRVYSAAAGAVDAHDPECVPKLDACIASFEWLAIDLDGGAERLLWDLTDEARNRRGPWRPRDKTWISADQLVFTRGSPRPDGYPWSIIYTLDTNTGGIEEAVAESTGADLDQLSYVSPGKLLYFVHSADVVRPMMDYFRDTPFAAQDRAKVNRWSQQGWFARLADFSTKRATVRTLPYLGFAEMQGCLSPDARFYAYPGEGNGQSPFALYILDLETGRREMLPGEISRLCGWHPQGDRLLATLTQNVPADPPGVLVEIPVDYVIEALKEGREVVAPPAPARPADHLIRGTTP